MGARQRIVDRCLVRMDVRLTLDIPLDIRMKRLAVGSIDHACPDMVGLPILDPDNCSLADRTASGIRQCLAFLVVHVLALTAHPGLVDFNRPPN